MGIVNAQQVCAGQCFCFQKRVEDSKFDSQSPFNSDRGRGSVFQIKLDTFWILWIIHLLCIMKINNVQGDLTR